MNITVVIQSQPSCLTKPQEGTVKMQLSHMNHVVWSLFTRTLIFFFFSVYTQYAVPVIILKVMSYGLHILTLFMLQHCW